MGQDNSAVDLTRHQRQGIWAENYYDDAHVDHVDHGDHDYDFHGIRVKNYYDHDDILNHDDTLYEHYDDEDDNDNLFDDGDDDDDAFTSTKVS